MTNRHDAVFTFPVVGTASAADPAVGPVRVENRPYIVLVDAKLYAFGNTYSQAVRVFRARIAGGFAAERAAMWNKATFVELSDEDARDIRHCLEATEVRS